MDLRAPQALIRIDISDTTQEALIQQECLDPRAAGSRLLHKFFNTNFQGISTEGLQFLRERLRSQVSKPTEAARIGVAQLAGIVEQETGVSVFLARLSGGIRPDLSRHSEMHEQCGGTSVPVFCRRDSGIDLRKPQKHEFSVALHGFDLPSRQMLLERGRVIDEIRFPEADGNNSPAHDRSPQASRYCFDFRKFRHEGIANKITHPLAAAQATEANPTGSAIGRSFCRSLRKS